MKHDAYLQHGGGRQEPRVIIIHSMGEYILNGQKDGKPNYQHAVKFLDDYGLSAHSLIGSDGSNYRCRHDDAIAYHARGFNTDSLGMEFLVPGDHNYSSFIEAIKQPYLMEAQYQAGLEQVKEWLNAWPIKSIVRHSDISPGRKVDPGDGFPWRDFLHDLGW